MPAPERYFQRVRKICDYFNILLIADEVRSGWGRTRTLWGIEHWELTPHILTTAKGLSAGYTPISAVAGREDLRRTLEQAHSPFLAGHTLNANAVSCAGAIDVIHYILENNLVGNAHDRGNQVEASLQEIKAKHSIIGDVHGLGLLFGFEFVKNRITKEPFPPEQRVSRIFENAALNRGLVTYPCGGSANGIAADMVLFAPPLIITQEQITEIFRIIDGALNDVEYRPGSK
jgi:adenosylmethionine-8-amino-7-oxononanoate aminotransferase